MFNAFCPCCGVTYYPNPILEEGDVFDDRHRMFIMAISGVHFHNSERLYSLDLLISWRTHLAKGLSPTSTIEASFESIEVIRLLKKGGGFDKKSAALDSDHEVF